MAITLSVVAVLQWIVGVTVFQRSPQDTVRVQQMLPSAPERIQSEEVPRMQVVMRNFKIYLGVEVALLIASLLVLASAAPSGDTAGRCEPTGPADEGPAPIRGGPPHVEVAPPAQQLSRA